jgi:TIR domain/Bacterial SH3 domain
MGGLCYRILRMESTIFLPLGRETGVKNMARIEKTVFISYRRTNASWALAVYENLTRYGYDVFYDFNGIASGDFERVIIENIKARAHFLVLLTPSALDRCGEPGDWLRREIEIAMESQRNIIPLTLENFDFGSPGIDKQLTGELTKFKRYNALPVPTEYFAEAMDRLRDKYLNVPLNAVLHPASSTAQKAAEVVKVWVEANGLSLNLEKSHVGTHQLAASSAPEVQETALTAQEWFEQGFNATDPDEKLRCYSEAIRLKADFAIAYANRGAARREKGDLGGALKDLDEAIRLKPDYAPAWGFVRGRWGGDFEQFPALPSSPLQPKRSWAGVGIGVMLGLVISAGTVLYSRQSGSLAALGVNVGTLRVYDTAFVRDKPRSDANITGTLESGTRIKVQSKTGDYFRVSSLDREPISGYVHRDDAFFEPTK